MSSNLLIAVPAALGAACMFGVSSVMMFRAAHAAPSGDLLRLRLLTRLMRSRLWLLGVGLQAASFGVQALALAFGPLTIVQPLAATDLLFAFPFLAHVQGRQMRRVEWCAGAMVALGVGVFLSVTPTGGGTATGSGPRFVVALAITGSIIMSFAAAGAGSRGIRRTTLLAVASAITFGVVDALTKSSIGELHLGGLSGLFTTWSVYALLAAGIAGLVLSQSAFSTGQLQASLPVIDSLEPIVAVLLGVVVFAEPLAGSSGLLAAQMAGAAIAVVGIVLLDRSPVTREAHQPASPGGSHSECLAAPAHHTRLGQQSFLGRKARVPSRTSDAGGRLPPP